MQRVVADLDEISWTKTQVRDVRGVTEVQMGKSIVHLTGLRYWMVQMATIAPEHVPIRAGGILHCRCRCNRHSVATARGVSALRATPSDL